MKALLHIQNVAIRIGETDVVRDFSLSITSGEIHALMGPNGSGKSSLAYAIAGHPEYRVTGGSVTLDGVDLLTLSPEKRAEAGLFLSFQEPPEVGGVSMATFLQMISANHSACHADPPAGGEASGMQSGKTNEILHFVQDDIRSMLKEIGLHDDFLRRFVNEGFSGGEKKKSELLQLVARKPKIAICDEIDAGLDLDALKSVAKVLRGEAARGAGLLVISHSPRLFALIRPDFVHVLLKGKIAASGAADVLKKLERDGYGAFPSR